MMMVVTHNIVCGQVVSMSDMASQFHMDWQKGVTYVLIF